MSKRVTVEELEANLKENLEEVGRGRMVEIVSYGRVVAQIIPPMFAHYPEPDTPPFGEYEPKVPRPETLDADPAEVLIEEREAERSGRKYK